jgi:hypothetical protein
MSDLLSEHLEMMQNGKIPTSPNFICPICKGSAHISASESWRDKTLLNISIWCDDCLQAVESCGERAWTGYENLLRFVP